MARVLIVEDDASINQMLSELLTDAGYKVDQAFSGTEALLRLRLAAYDLMLLDQMLPGMTGAEILSQLEPERHPPTIMLTARTATEEKVEMLKLGVDDYLTKPFNNDELLARIEALLRRSQGGPKAPRPDNSAIRYRDLELVKDEMRLTVKGQVVPLTNFEFEILALLISKPGKVFTKNQIFETVWGYTYMGEEKALNTHISNLRKKLAQASDETYIETVWGLGFKVRKEDDF